MDLLKLIRSFGDLLFEVLSWLIYYPRTLWLVLKHPLRMIEYSNHEQRDRDEEQYSDTLSPPLLLLLTIVLLHALEVGLGRAGEIQARNAAIQSILDSDQNLVLLRSFLFGLLPLFAALHWVRKRDLPLERRNLRPPFFGQCYIAAIHALQVSAATLVGGAGFKGASVFGLLIAVASVTWYLTVQAMQFRRSLDLIWLRAVGSALWVYLVALLYLLALALIIAGGSVGQ